MLAPFDVSGSVLVFQHNIMHEGSELIKGQKYTMRTDVMYTKENTYGSTTINGIKTELNPPPEFFEVPDADKTVDADNCVQVDEGNSREQPEEHISAKEMSELVIESTNGNTDEGNSCEQPEEHISAKEMSELVIEPTNGNTNETNN